MPESSALEKDYLSAHEESFLKANTLLLLLVSTYLPTWNWKYLKSIIFNN